MRLKAYAKINLGLKILNQRPDGYHNIQSIFIPINFFDQLQVTQISQGIEFDSNLPPYGRENLCFKSAVLFFQKVKLNLGVKIVLKKNIWIGAGLGGGSSCAAQVLIGMNKIFGNPLSEKELKEIALKIGSDVPFFLKNRPAMVEGRGEIIISLPHLPKPLWFVIVYPNFSVSTKWAYEEFKNCLTKSKWNFNILKQYFLENKIKELARNLCNDFEEIVFFKYPELKRIKEKLLKYGVLGASLSGSGSCIYGILERKERRIERIFPEYKVKVVSSRVV